MESISEKEKAFMQMVRQNERLIYKVCSFYISEEYSLQDLYQDVIINLWSGFDKFRDESSYSTWIYRVAFNTCISELRKGKRKPQNVPISLWQETLVEPEDMNEQIQEMYRLIHQLKTIEKAIVLLYLEEKSYQEIAEITGLTISNVATKLKRSKQKLKEMSNH